MLDACACTRVRTASRLITRSYDYLLRDTGLKASQVSVLAGVDVSSEVSISALSKRLLMDRTTLSRNLKPLVAEGLVELGQESWRRSKVVRITPKGRARLGKALPLWEQAQSDLLKRVGRQRWQAISAQLSELISKY
jgi:Transcriptional regulators